MSRTKTRNTKVREKVRYRANRRCELCGIDVNCRGSQTDPDFPTMHHRWPRREGGSDHVDNLLYLCRYCHSVTVHEDEELARIFGWMASRDDYKGTPVLSHLGWVWLTEDGQYSTLSDTECDQLNRRHGNHLNRLSA